MQPSFGAYYESLAASYTLPSLGLVYVYCISHRSRATAILAVVATIGVVLLIGSAAVFPKDPRSDQTVHVVPETRG